MLGQRRRPAAPVRRVFRVRLDRRTGAPADAHPTGLLAGPQVLARRAAAAALGAVAARTALAIGRSMTAPSAAPRPATDAVTVSRWDRTNHRGERVSLLAGPAYAAGAAMACALAPGVSRPLRTAAVVAAVAAGAVGLLDDLGGSSADRGFRGHLRALRRGKVTTGVVKIAGLAGTGMLSARLLGHRGVDTLLSGAVVAGMANLFNLFDLRPGRASKVALVHTPALLLPMPGMTLLAPPLGAAVGLLRQDLRERTMLGDAGANALGAGIGVAAIAAYGRPGRLAHLVGLVALTLASERVSFSRVIEQTPPLRWLDGLGRRG